VSAGLDIAPAGRSRTLPAVAAIVLAVLGVIGVAARLDAPGDGSILPLEWSTLRPDGVVVTVADPAESILRTGDLVTAIDGDRLGDRFGTVDRRPPGEVLPYDVVRSGDTAVLNVRVRRPAIGPLIADAWGNLVFVLALAALAVALYVRRPNEPSTGPLLVLGAGLLSSTAVVVGGLPALALATGGAQFWLFHLNTVGAYSIAWGALLAFSLTLTHGHPWSGRAAIRVAYAGPVVVMLLWSAVVVATQDNPVRALALVHSGQTAVVAGALLLGIVMGVVAYRTTRDPLMLSRLRWIGGGGALAAILGVVGWHAPQLITGDQVLPWGALGLSGLPFVAGIGVALRRHRLFDIVRLANRSLVYAATIAVLAAGYAVVVALLASVLDLSDAVAAGLAAAGAALALAPLRTGAQRAVDRLMYGDRNDPQGALDRLGARLQSVMLPADVLPAVVHAVARSLRVPYVAIDLADGAGGFLPGAEWGVPVEAVHSELLHYQGQTVGRLRVSARGTDDPLDIGDVALLGSLAQQVGTAVQAVRLHDDLVRSRAEVVASREDERRRLRRDLHDGLGPALAAIGLKAGLAAREVPAGARAGALLGEISAEAAASLGDVRRLVEALRPPALDELGLTGAVRSRAASLAGPVAIEVRWDGTPGPLPAAVETAAYRIAVEAMTNVVRHSGATTCTVLIALRPEAVEVTVGDDGQGLDPARAAGVGLRSMRERADEIGGTVSISSAPEGGTIVHARLPLDADGRAA
jgi:signal transduction histidine kinase